MNSNHEQTETYRTGFFGLYVMFLVFIDKLVSNDLHTIITSYAIAITTGSAPSGNLDTSFMDSLNLQGYVGASGRGTVSGSYSGTLSGQPVTIGFKVQSLMIGDDSSSFLQEFCSTVLGFWFRVRCIQEALVIGFQSFVSYSGQFTRNMMKPGTYTVTLFQGELEAGSGSVTVTTGGTSSITLSSTLNLPSTIWSIGK